MVLGKKTIDYSVKYIPISEKTKEFKQNTFKNKKQSEQIQTISGGGKPNTRNQNKFFSKNNKNFVKDFAAGRLRILK